MVSENKAEGEYLQRLRDFIDSNPDSREQKRALAVMMWIEGLPNSKIQSILNVSSAFISRYKIIFFENGVEGLKLGYKGSKGYLTPEEHLEIIHHLESQENWILQDIQDYIEDKYNIVFKSKQSYYDLLKEASISWKKTQKKNPKKNDELVESRKKEIEEILESNREDIEAGRLIVYMIDECHLLWGDACGYVWGKTNIRIEIPMTNEKERTTYFGALNYLTKQFLIKEYDAGNSENTVSFLKYLQNLNPDARILIFWDGASYHKFSKTRDYLGEINKGLEKDNWVITCELFAPNAPEQNPVEDIWLQGKRFIREYWFLCKSFSIIKILFELAMNFQIFNFPKLDTYGTFAKSPELMPV